MTAFAHQDEFFMVLDRAILTDKYACHWQLKIGLYPFDFIGENKEAWILNPIHHFCYGQSKIVGWAYAVDIENPFVRDIVTPSYVNGN